ncbi:MAG: hypothetical protein FIB08_10390 [Candidatus Methanoperedens sp.]|nr:hypothetical protein [Candidatus Methanoperedens sp.]
MAKEFIREIKGHKYKYLVYWDKTEKKQKQKYLGRVDIEKAVIMKSPTEKEVAEAIIEIGGGLIERKHLEKWIKRLKFKENMDTLRSLFVG